MATVTLAELRANVRSRCDMVNSEFVADTATELDKFINMAYAEVYDLLVEVFEDYFFSQTTFTTASGVETYNLPANFHKLRGVDLVLSASPGNYVPLRRFEWAERWKYSSGWSVGYTSSGQLLRHMIRGSNPTQITFAPSPDGAYSIRVWYVPQYVPLVNPSDPTIDFANGWEDYVVTEAAIRCLQKEESDVSALFAQKNALIARIRTAAQNRDADEPMRMTKSRSERWDLEE